MDESTIHNMKMFQFVLFCLTDSVAILLCGAVFAMFLFRARLRRSDTEKLFASHVLMNFIVSLGGIVLGTRFHTGNARRLLDDSVMVQIAFSELGLFLNLLMISLDRLVALVLPLRYPDMFARKHTWIMIGVTWIIPILTSLLSMIVITGVESTTTVSYGLAVLTAATALTSLIVLSILNLAIYYEIKRQTRNMTLLALTRGELKGATLCVFTVGFFIMLWIPQTMFVFGKLMLSSYLIDLWFTVFANTMVLVYAVTSVTLYLLYDHDMVKAFKMLFSEILDMIFDDN